MINQELENLYQNKKSQLKGHFEGEDDVEGPLLMYCWEDDYLKSDYKILFIGKEPNGHIGWYSDEIDILLDWYKDFRLCKKEGSGFTNIWKGMYYVNNKLNQFSNNSPNFLWTNVSKCCKDGKNINWEQHKKFVEKFDVLVEEIKIVNPDVVVFFTGPSYDDKIKIQFKEDVQFKKVMNDVPSREFAQLINPNLPFHTYRLYHPDYSLWRDTSKKIHIDVMIEKIKKANK
jgi:hypothetical protein